MTDEQTRQSNQTSSDTPLSQFMYHQRRAAEESIKALAGWIPQEVRTHGKAAGKEFLQSFKVLLEGVASDVEREVNRMRSTDDERSDDASGPSTTGRNKVKVEVS
jgi:hypothetical protein